MLYMLYKAFYSSTGFAKFFLLNLSDHICGVSGSVMSPGHRREVGRHTGDTEAETCGSRVRACPCEK